MGARIIRLVSLAFCPPSGNCFNRSNNSCSLFKASCRPCSNFRWLASDSQVLIIPRTAGTSVVGLSLRNGSTVGPRRFPVAH